MRSVAHTFHLGTHNAAPSAYLNPLRDRKYNQGFTLDPSSGTFTGNVTFTIEHCPRQPKVQDPPRRCASESLRCVCVYSLGSTVVAQLVFSRITFFLRDFGHTVAESFRTRSPAKKFGRNKPSQQHADAPHHLPNRGVPSAVPFLPFAAQTFIHVACRVYCPSVYCPSVASSVLQCMCSSPAFRICATIAGIGRCSSNPSARYIIYYCYCLGNIYHIAIALTPPTAVEPTNVLAPEKALAGGALRKPNERHSAAHTTAFSSRTRVLALGYGQRYETRDSEQSHGIHSQQRMPD